MAVNVLIMTQFNDYFCTQFPSLGGAGNKSTDNIRVTSELCTVKVGVTLNTQFSSSSIRSSHSSSSSNSISRL